MLTNKPDYFAVASHITSDGHGPAFNVRFGVEFGRVRFAQKMLPADPDTGNVHRIVRQGERLPPSGSWPVLVPALTLVGSASDRLDEERLRCPPVVALVEKFQLALDTDSRCSAPKLFRVI